MIDLTKAYRTRNGLRVVNLQHKPGFATGARIQGGVIRPTGTLDHTVWFEDGRFFAPPTEHELDLIEVLPTSSEKRAAELEGLQQDFRKYVEQNNTRLEQMNEYVQRALDRATGTHEKIVAVKQDAQREINALSNRIDTLRDRLNQKAEPTAHTPTIKRATSGAYNGWYCAGVPEPDTNVLVEYNASSIAKAHHVMQHSGERWRWGDKAAAIASKDFAPVRWRYVEGL